jgi:hypothetical protein
MTRNTAFTVLATATALGVLGATTAWAGFDLFERRHKGGYVIPCSLDGVNPVFHPDIFGNPAVARSYGFYLGRDHAWHVIPGCHIW